MFGREGAWERVSWQRFLLLSLLGALLWALILKFYFPGYLDPFVPFHLDHFIYLGDSSEGYGLSRYILHYPRPLGNTLFDLIGRLGVRGMLVPVFLIALANGTLLILYVERLTGQTTRLFSVAVFLVLVYANPESYSSVKEDILAVVCLCFVLIAFHCWQNYVESGKAINILVLLLAALLASYVKETYFATLVVFFAIQSVIARGRRKTAVLLSIANIAIAALSLIYNARIAVFVNPHATKQGPYYQDWSPLAILHGYHVLLKWLVLPVPTLIIVAALALLFLKSRYRFYIGLVALLFIATTLFPHALLINHLEDQYAWLGAYFFFVPILLADGILPRARTEAALLAATAVLLCAVSLREYRKDMGGMAGWLREQEINERHLLRFWPVLEKTAKPNEQELVLGLAIFNDPFRVPSFIKRSFPATTAWTVVVPDDSAVSQVPGIQFVHPEDLHSGNFAHVFVFSKDAHLVKVYSAAEIPDAVHSGQLPKALAAS